MGGIQVLVLGLVVLPFVWRARLTRASAIAIAAIGIAGAIGVALLFARVHAMPREPTRLDNPKLDNLAKVLVASDDELLLLGQDEIVSVRLPSGRVAARLRNQKQGLIVVVSTIAERGAVLFSFFRDAHDNGWAFVPPGRDRVDWHEQTHPAERYTPPPSAYWDSSHERFVIASESGSERADLRRISLTPIGIDGNRSGEPEQFDVPWNDLPSNPNFCLSGGQLYAAGDRKLCKFGPPDGEVRRCNPVRAEASCPGAIEMEPGAWLRQGSLQPALVMPGNFAGATLTERSIAVGRDGMWPRGEWITADLGRAVSLGNSFLVLTHEGEDDSARLGHMREAHARVELYDRVGKLQARTRLFRPPFAWYAAAAGDQVVLLDFSLDRVVRFDPRTLERLDPPDVEPALARLRIWGGRSRIYEAALFGVFGATPALLLALGWAQFRRKGAELRFWQWLGRASAVFAVIALSVLATTVAKISFW
jgi:hypothetical protein